MNNKAKKYLELLFDPEDHICAGNSFKVRKCTNVQSVINGSAPTFVCINALTEGSTRSKHNICKYRNFVLEFDDIPLDEQLDYVDNIGIPYTTCVFSGGKSYHFIISLAEPLIDAKQWRFISDWIYSSIPKADPACNDAARLSRCAEGQRDVSGRLVKQSCMRLGDRITNEVLIMYLSRFPLPENKDMTVRVSTHRPSLETFGIDIPDDFRGRLLNTTIDFIQTGGRKGQRRSQLFKAACDMRDQRYEYSDAELMLLHKISEIYSIEGRPAQELEDCRSSIRDAYVKYKPNLPRF